MICDKANNLAQNLTSVPNGQNMAHIYICKSVPKGPFCSSELLELLEECIDYGGS